MKMRKWYIVVTVLLIIVVVYLLFFRKTGVSVKEIRIKNEVVKRTVSAAGVVKSQDEANLSFTTAGRVLDIAVNKGDIVTKDQYLAVLDNYAESQTAQALKDARDIAQRDLELYIEDFESNMDAVGGKDEYRIEKSKYEELLSKAEALYQAQLGSLSKTYIYAPFEGKVIDIYKEVGETALAGTSVFKVANENLKIFEIDLDQEDYGFLKEGQEVEITLDAYEDKIFSGKVDSLPNYIKTDGGGDFIIEIILNGEDTEKTLLGMTGDAFIILSKTDKEVRALTFDEIQYDIEENPFLYVFHKDKVEVQYIELGLKGDIYTEIRSAIEKPIIQESDAKHNLEEGLKVKLIK